jgi:23S rRNA pseudouridine2457 synthase
MQYLLFNKPYGVLCQFSDELGRPTLKDYLPFPNIYAAGRLDLDSEGLLFLTDDGTVSHQITDPKHKQEKTYWVQVEGVPTEEQANKLKKGVMIEGKKTLPAKVRILAEPPALWKRTKPIRYRQSIPTAWLEMTIREGMNRQVRKMTASVGLPCLRLVRIAIGQLKLGTLQPGEYKVITRPELTR